MGGTANSSDRRSRGSARALAAVLVLASGAAALVAAGACLPDLAAIPDDDAAATQVPLGQYCGDGLIKIGPGGGDAGEACDPGPDAGAGCTKGCQITCESGGKIDPTTGHCYFFGKNTDDSFTSAQRQCLANNAHVVTFASAQELAFVAKELGNDGYWVGLEPRPASSAYVSAQPEEPGYPFPSNGPCEGCFGAASDGGPFMGGSDTCVAASGGSWFGVPCLKDGGPNLRTICEREPAGSRSITDCFFGGLCFSIARSQAAKQYVVVQQLSDPVEAGAQCNSFPGGKLAIFETAEEREQAGHELVPLLPADGEVWIGLVEDGGRWQWEDGTSADLDGGRPAPWGNAQPSAPPRARAFLRFSRAAYDTQLAYTDPDAAPIPRWSLCQRPPQ